MSDQMGTDDDVGVVVSIMQHHLKSYCAEFYKDEIDKIYEETHGDKYREEEGSREKREIAKNIFYEKHLKLLDLLNGILKDATKGIPQNQVAEVIFQNLVTNLEKEQSIPGLSDFLMKKLRQDKSKILAVISRKLNSAPVSSNFKKAHDDFVLVLQYFKENWDELIKISGVKAYLEGPFKSKENIEKIIGDSDKSALQQDVIKALSKAFSFCTHPDKQKQIPPLSPALLEIASRITPTKNMVLNEYETYKKSFASNPQDSPQDSIKLAMEGPQSVSSAVPMLEWPEAEPDDDLELSVDSETSSEPDREPDRDLEDPEDVAVLEIASASTASPSPKDDLREGTGSEPDDDAPEDPDAPGGTSTLLTATTTKKRPKPGSEGEEEDHGPDAKKGRGKPATAKVEGDDGSPDPATDPKAKDVSLSSGGGTSGDIAAALKEAKDTGEGDPKNWYLCRYLTAGYMSADIDLSAPSDDPLKVTVAGTPIKTETLAQIIPVLEKYAGGNNNALQGITPPELVDSLEGKDGKPPTWRPLLDIVPEIASLKTTTTRGNDKTFVTDKATIATLHPATDSNLLAIYPPTNSTDLKSQVQNKSTAAMLSAPALTGKRVIATASKNGKEVPPDFDYNTLSPEQMIELARTFAGLLAKGVNVDCTELSNNIGEHIADPKVHLAMVGNLTNALGGKNKHLQKDIANITNFAELVEYVHNVEPHDYYNRPSPDVKYPQDQRQRAEDVRNQAKDLSLTSKDATDGATFDSPARDQHGVNFDSPAQNQRLHFDSPERRSSNPDHHGDKRPDGSPGKPDGSPEGGPKSHKRSPERPDAPDRGPDAPEEAPGLGGKRKRTDDSPDDPTDTDLGTLRKKTKKH